MMPRSSNKIISIEGRCQFQTSKDKQSHQQRSFDSIAQDLLLLNDQLNHDEINVSEARQQKYF